MLGKISFIIAFIAFNTHANTVYKCQNGERIIFSQMPCKADNTKNEKLDYSNVQNSISAEPTQANSTKKNMSPANYMLSKKKI